MFKLKLKICSLMLLLCVIKCECGIIDSFIGTVKDTTNALKADVHNIVAYGNDLVFGDTVTKHIIPSDAQVPDEHKTEGLITGVFHRATSAIYAVNERVRNIFKSDTDNPHKGMITRMFDVVNKKLKSIQERFVPTNDTKQLLDIPSKYGDLLNEDAKVVREKVIKVLLRNNTDMFNKLNITEEDIRNLFKDTKNTVKDKIVLPADAKVDADVGVQIDVRSLAENVKEKL